MRRDKDRLACLDGRQDVLVKVGQHTVGCELERLAARRGHIERAAPHVHLLLAPLLAGVVLVQAGELTVVTLVQGLVLGHREVLLADGLQLDRKRLLRPLQRRRECLVKVGVAELLQLLGALKRLGLALLREGRVLPASEKVQLVPFRLAVTSKHKSSAWSDHRQPTQPYCRENGSGWPATRAFGPHGSTCRSRGTQLSDKLCRRHRWGRRRSAQRRQKKDAHDCGISTSKHLEYSRADLIDRSQYGARSAVGRGTSLILTTERARKCRMRE